MRSDDLIRAVRRHAQLDEEHPDYTNAVILEECNAFMSSTLTPALFAARTGLLLKRFSQQTAVDIDVYRLPPRAIAGALEDLVCYTGTDYWQLRQIEPAQAWRYDGAATGRPLVYVMLGSSVRLYPSPDAAYILRMQYYLRPSKLVEHQTVGLISAIAYDPTSSSYDSTATSRRLTASTGLIDRETGAAVPSGSTDAFYDVIRAGSAQTGTVYGQWGGSTYEVVMAHGRPSTVTGDTLFTFDLDTEAAFAAAGLPRYPQSDMSEVLPGDWLRVAGQSDWPTIPDEFHTTLARGAATTILMDCGMHSDAKIQASKVSSDLDQLKDMIQPRVRSGGQRLVPRAHMLRYR